MSAPVDAVAPAALLEPSRDHRGSPIPTGSMIATRFMELRKRRGLMITLILVTVGFPTVFLAIRLLLHAVAPKTYGAAGGYDIYTAMAAGVLYTFGFIVAATLGCTAGSADLSDGMFRHLVITGRSRLALYLARIPAGLAIIASLVAIGFAIVCAVCVLAAPSKLNYDGVAVPAGMSQSGLETWAADHATEVVCNFDNRGQPGQNIGCENGPGQPDRVVIQGPSGQPIPATTAQATAAAIEIAQQDYSDYHKQFLYPSDSLMIKTGLWLELEAAIGFIVGLGLGSLLGQRTTAVILMIVLEVILTPIAIRTRIPHFINVQRGIVGVATAHVEPGQLPLAFGGGGNDFRITESTTTAVCVILAWLIGWTIIGAWRMMTRDA
ncbi:MAG TPA: hypothetical protein VK662_10745 [Acidothermaceae bacterium]|jgi:hypothetical protein|nr:hypothetical protein [Acidothermaceae bacterium]